MLWTRDSKRTLFTPDNLDGLPAYKWWAYMLFTSGLTNMLLTIYDN